MTYEDLPQRWKQKLKKWLISQGEYQRERPSAHVFNAEVVAKIKFEDESYAEFNNALIIEVPEWNEVGVFTEHCGYHIFSLGGTHVVMESTIR
jgi:hypothetical protein